MNNPQPGKVIAMKTSGCCVGVWVLLGLMLSGSAFAQAEGQPNITPQELEEWFQREKVRQTKSLKVIERGVAYLLQTQGADGSWSPERGPGITALAVRALAMYPKVGPEHPAVKKGVQFLEGFAREDGGYYSDHGLYKNYEGCVVLSALVAVGKTQYADKIDKLQQFLVNSQWDEGEDIQRDNPFYGGAGYGRSKRPDLSNTQMLVEALHDSGLPKDHPAYQKALVFIQRCQMRSESNDMPYAKGSKQGGFIYATANGGESKAGEFEIDGRKELRSYGSMTYGGMKSMIYADLKRDDPRVTAAVDWIRRNWTLDANPNMPPEQAYEGLYYYYHTFARAHEALEQDVIVLADGRRMDWRIELINELGERQLRDGNWVNESDRWMEGDANLVTAYSLIAAQTAYPYGQRLPGRSIKLKQATPQPVEPVQPTRPATPPTE